VAHDLSAWRLVRPAYREAAAAYSGVGARLYGGRWNAPGRRLLYASLHLSLAVLETLPTPTGAASGATT
jgi:RES domain-containing protein